MHAVPVADPAEEETVPLTALDDAITREYQKSWGLSVLRNVVLMLLVIVVAVLLFRDLHRTPNISGPGHVKTRCPQCDSPTCADERKGHSKHLVPSTNCSTLPFVELLSASPKCQQLFTRGGPLTVELLSGTVVTGRPSRATFQALTLLGAVHVSWSVVTEAVFRGGVGDIMLLDGSTVSAQVDFGSTTLETDVGVINMPGVLTLKKLTQGTCTPASVLVLSNDHVSGEQSRGTYFNFDVAAASKAYGEKIRYNHKYLMKNKRTGKTAMAVLWTKPNGGSVGDGHGRWDDGSAQRNDFQERDCVEFVAPACRKCPMELLSECQPLREVFRCNSTCE